MSDATATEEITIYADYVCPFCYIGRESLDRYLEQRGDDIEIRWHPFDLRAGKRGPDGEIDESVDDGKDEEYFEQARQNVRRLKEQYGVDMTREMATDVDSLDAQVASYYVRENYPYERWRTFDEAIYDAIWRDERDVGDEEVLLDVAEDAGLNPDEIREAITDEGLRAEVKERFEEASERGITGVPTFVNEGHAARGAVPPEHLERLVEG